jgi:Putative zinc-finger
MVESLGNREPPKDPESDHEDFLELSALAASGNLTEAECERLREHLAACAQCSEAAAEFQEIVDEAIPRFASGLTTELPLNASFPQEKAAEEFQKRLAREKVRERQGPEASAARLLPLVVQRSRRFRQQFERYDLWLPLAASVILCATLGILSYRTGKSRGIEWARTEERSKPSVEAARGSSVSTLRAPSSHDADLAARDSVLTDLRREIAEKSSELERLKAQAASQQAAFAANADDKKTIAEERDRLLTKVSADETVLRETQEKLQRLEQERADYAIHTASYETKIADLSASLDERDRQTAEQQDLLAKDRDIRELIGARDLYITEIYDVAHNGDTRKAAGRVFYTKGKSLIFYAYDLTETPGLKQASTFEAWGQRGSDWRQASKLGIFYEDSATKKRWVVKSNDRKALDQLDAVFITVEPNGGSERPTGKPLLFAYLKVPANHP